MPHYPYLEFTVAIGSWDWGSEAYVDTGFEGAICIPAALEDEIDAQPAYTRFRMADGTIREVPTWGGTLWLEEHPFQVDVIGLGRECPLGREVLDQVEICFRFGRELRVTFAKD